MSLIEKSQIVVLHLTKHGDSGVVIHTIDSLAGRRSLYFRGLLNGKNSAARSHFHPLSILDIVAATSPKSSLAYLREYSRNIDLNSIVGEPYKGSIAMFISEVLYRSLRSDDGDNSLFPWLVKSITTLDAITTSIANFHLYWLTAYCCRLGFQPEDNYSAENQIFSVENSIFCTSNPQNAPLFFTKEESLLLHQMLTLPLPEALALPLSASKRVAFSKRMIQYLSYHLGCEINIKSLSALHDLFN